MQIQTDFKKLAKELLPMKFDRAEYYGILSFWREYDPKRVENLLFKGILRRTLKLTANTLWNMQLTLEETELLPPALARSEAWNRLMRIEDDDDDEEKEMSLEKYLSRL